MKTGCVGLQSLHHPVTAILRIVIDIRVQAKRIENIAEYVQTRGPVTRSVPAKLDGKYCAVVLNSPVDSAQDRTNEHKLPTIAHILLPGPGVDSVST